VPLITADQLLAHAVGDYILQSDWMATEKTKRNTAAGAHAMTYAIPFLLFHPSLAALVVIIGTHFLIDRFRLARFVVWAKNLITPEQRFGWAECSWTGYPPNTPEFLAVWLLIIADNIMHIIINGLALRFL
jgi:hypothetical protein